MINPQTIVLPSGKSYQYVPLLDQLTSILADEKAASHVARSQERVRGRYGSIMGGSKV